MNRYLKIATDIINTTISLGFTGHNIDKMDCDYDLLLKSLSTIMLIYCSWNPDTGLPIPIQDQTWNRIIVQIPNAYNNCKTCRVSGTIDKLDIDVTRLLCKLVRDLQKKLKSSDELANVLTYL